MKTETTKFTRKEWSEMGYEKANEILRPMDTVERLDALSDAPKSMTPYAHWIRVSKAELMQMYMNAVVTHYDCSGHHKAKMNELQVENFEKLMKEYGIPIPSNEICFILGQFNGKGSY